MDGWMGGWMGVKAALRISAAINSLFTGWVDRWMGLKASLRLLTAIKNLKMLLIFKMVEL